ncbi:acyl-CoA dehydrogenase family protein [Streptomyces sp. NPDC005784]|uniref:acyl-CoA dehydrogenase family protein n=1 Tax=Streptomyces sp. NPDC005784 TaxID=3364731 RepID=UPI0036A8B736
MDFRLTDDQRALRHGIRELLEGRFGREALRAAVDRADGRGGTGGANRADGARGANRADGARGANRADGARGARGTADGKHPDGGRVLDRELWHELGAAGFFALRLPEAEGGVGQGLPEAVLAFEEAGRVLLPGPLIATHLAAGAVAGAATGEVVVASVDGGLVEWLDEADVVRGNATGAEPLASVDPLTPLHRLPAATASRPESGALRGPWTPGGPGGPPGPPGLGGPPAPDTLGAPAPPRAEEALLASLLTAAEQLGSAARTCETAVQHARTREQFGQPIGAFQAVQHLCAGMLVRVEVARAAVYAASVTADPVDIAAARLLADDAAVRGARDCLQVSGGMGFTWESDVHLHLKRAWIRTHRAGGATQREEELADDLAAGTA